jgi:amino acid transporter
VSEPPPERVSCQPPQTSQPSVQHLTRGLSTGSALAVNVIDMVGVGPFVTLPLIVIAMGGPQAMLGWVLGAVLSLADGLVWSELGAAYPEAGGSYAYLKHLYGGKRLGSALSFLYAWQILFSAPLSIASGCIGFSLYAGSLLPGLSTRTVSFALLHVPVVLSFQTLIAMAICLLAAVVLHSRIQSLDRVVKGLGLAVVGALVWIIAVGFTHFHAAQAFRFPPGAFAFSPAFFAGLGAGMLISTYDYWGYYNVCFLGAEIRDPQRTIPRAVLGSIAIVAVLYLLMNIGVLGVIPWREFTSASATAALRTAPMAVFMQRAFPGHGGHIAALIIVVFISLAAAASVLALLLGYSRIPYAAALDGNFPKVFSRLHPRYGIPYISLRVLAGITLVCCLFRLQEVISTLVVIRILFQFLLQGAGVLLPSHRRARRRIGFRMPLYPLPVVLALCGFLFILFSRPHFLTEMRSASAILLAGAVVLAVRSYRRKLASQAGPLRS